MSKEKDQHINVFVRIKPVNTTDKVHALEKCVVDVISDKKIIVYERSHGRSSKMFTFDGVFGPTSNQVDVYNTVINPLLKEVIAGYSCTVFAYGQTGTGKTYTMEGDRIDNSNWQSDTSAGMIPRCLSHLFDELQLLENQQYIVRVNFLELYNEELFDLLTDDNDAPLKIKLYEDVTKKGSVIIHGLEEVTVHNKAEIYRILKKGSEKRQTAATILNSKSSRSHTVFSITIHTKENTSGGEELLKTARLNLVDLAGSEHVGRSGAVDKRMREARSINQSLLTLGRVITALVEKAPHIPYRESKLTRLLQESLGGRTKTSIIATISSVSSNLEETLSTLDYAYRAKNITNRPEINQKVCKRALLKEYTKEIERLRRDLEATRKRNGVYVNDYDAMQTLIDCQRNEIKEKRNYCKVLEDVMESKEKLFNDLQSQYDIQVGQLTKNMGELNDMNSYLQTTREFLRKIECDKNKQKLLVEKYVEAEKILHGQMETVLSVVNEATEDAQKLHDKLDRKTKTEEENKKLVLQMRSDFTTHCRNIEDIFLLYKKEIDGLLQSVKDEVETHIVAQTTYIESSIRSIVKAAVQQHFIESKRTKKNINTLYTYYQETLNTCMKDASNMIEDENKLLIDIYSKVAPEILDLLESNYKENFKQNLRVLNRNITQKLESVSMHVKHAMEIICRNRLEEYNCLCKSLSEINEHINRIFRNEKQITENYKEFGKKMEDLSCGFNILDKCERNYSEIVDTSHQINKICKNVYDQNSHGYFTDMMKQDNLKDVLQNITSIVKNDIDSGIDQMQISNKTAIEKTNVLVNNLQERLSTGCNILKRHNNNAQFIGKQLQEKMANDKDKILISNTKSFQITENMSLMHDRFVKNQQNKITNIFRMDDKFANQHMKLNNCSNNIIEELHESQKQIDKCLIDCCRDICTGATPEKKIFSYPRELTKMSSSEQIDQRFQESRNHSNDAEANNLDLITEHLSVSKMNSVTKSPNENRVSFVTSAPHNYSNMVNLNTCYSDTFPNPVWTDLS